MNIETTVLTHFTLIKHFFLDLGEDASTAVLGQVSIIKKEEH